MRDELNKENKKKIARRDKKEMPAFCLNQHIQMTEKNEKRDRTQFYIYIRIYEKIIF